jgi:4a-hydroxytetrahydrobiopterin dehydratase
MQKLSTGEIQQKLKETNGWQLDGIALKKEWQFKNFAEALQFINKVGAIAEKHDHHPELFNVYNRVTLRYYTHDTGGLTQRDFKVVTEIDKL